MLFPCMSQSQIKVRDLSNTAVTISPADYSSWHDARTELMVRRATRHQPIAPLTRLRRATERGQGGPQGARRGGAGRRRQRRRHAGAPRQVCGGGARDRALDRPHGAQLLGVARRHLQLPEVKHAIEPPQNAAGCSPQRRSRAQQVSVLRASCSDVRRQRPCSDAGPSHKSPVTVVNGVTRV